MTRAEIIARIAELEDELLRLRAALAALDACPPLNDDDAIDGHLWTDPPPERGA